MVLYKKPSSPAKYKEYLSERIENDEATVFIAYDDTNHPVGFSLNYHTFSSSHRKKGIGNVLISSSLNLAKEIGALRVDLSTAKDNVTAQTLYEKIGFKKNTEYFSYSLST